MITLCIITACLSACAALVHVVGWWRGTQPIAQPHLLQVLNYAVLTWLWLMMASYHGVLTGR